MNPILLVFLLSVLGVLGDALIKLSGQGKQPVDIKLFLLGFLAYMLTVPGWFVVMKQISLSSLGALYALSTILLLVAVDLVCFRGSIGKNELVGLLMALGAIVILRRFA